MDMMPPSKQLFLNALNFKKVLSRSHRMIELRLKMRDEFRKRLNNLTVNDLDDPNKEKVDPNEGDKVFRSLIRKMIFDLTVMHVKPEEKVINESESILNEDDDREWYEDKAKFYIILNGNFKVSSQRFNKRKKEHYSAIDDLFKKDEKDPHKASQKKLVSGDYFGEVSFLYKCRRTATVKAKLYATLGCIGHENMNEILRDYPNFRNHLQNDIVKIYDDDLKFFLTAALRKIDYLANVKDEVLVQLAYSCKAEIKEKGHILYNMDEDPDQ